MTRFHTKDELLKSIRAERKRLEDNLVDLTAEEWVRPGMCGEWSAKDMLAHLSEWESMFLSWFRAGLRGETPITPAPDLTWSQMDVLNQRIYDKHRQDSLAAVQAESKRSYAEILEVVEAMPEEELFVPHRYAWTGREALAGWIAANTCNHYLWAKTLVRKWKKAGR